MNPGPEVLTPQPRSVAENVGRIQASVGQIAQVQRERVVDAYAHGKERLRRAEASLEDHVRAKPLRSLAIAAGVGALCGLLLRRR